MTAPAKAAPDGEMNLNVGRPKMTTDHVRHDEPMADAKILLVDDNTTNLQVLRDALDGLGAKLLVAKNGAGALAIVAKARPDLILLDIMMPEMDGYEVCRRLKADEATRHIPVLFLTALSSAEDEAKGLALGAVDYITKPIHPDLVRARVRNHLELKRYQNHLEETVRAADAGAAADAGRDDREPGDARRVPRPRDRRPHQAHPELRQGPRREAQGPPAVLRRPGRRDHRDALPVGAAARHRQGGRARRRPAQEREAHRRGVRPDEEAHRVRPRGAAHHRAEARQEHLPAPRPRGRLLPPGEVGRLGVPAAG